MPLTPPRQLHWPNWAVREWFITTCFILSSTLSLAQVPPNIEWQRTYGGAGTDLGLSIAPTRDGHFVVTGTSTSSNGDVSLNQGAEDAWVLLIDSEGELLWQHTYGGSAYDSFLSVQATLDSGFIALVAQPPQTGMSKVSMAPWTLGW